MKVITVLIADDHKLIRDLWLFSLNSDPRFKVVAETSSGTEAVKLALDLRPDIIITDINMNPVDGFEITRMIRKVIPAAKIIGVSMHSIPIYVKRLMNEGAVGYVTKNSTRNEMITAILEVYKGNKFICDEIKDILANRELANDFNGQPDLNTLSKREVEITKCIRYGASSREIAEKLNISVKTVEVHRYNILKKLSLKNTASLVNFVNSEGL